jgi:putative membrane protein
VSLLERVLISWAGNLLALWAAAFLVGSVNASGFGSLVIAAAVFGLVNLIVKPVVQLLSLPVIVITFGIALFFINMAMLALTAWIVSGFEVGGFWSLAEGTLVIWAVNVVIGLITRRWRRRKRD